MNQQMVNRNLVSADSAMQSKNKPQIFKVLKLDELPQRPEAKRANQRWFTEQGTHN